MDINNNTIANNGTFITQFPYRDTLDRTFIVCLISLITVANILMGCELDLNAVFSTLKRPIAPAIGFFTQFIIMPVLAYSIALLVLSSKGMHLFALGLFVTGCSPGGGASNYWTILLDGNTNLSITMTFLSMIAALLMMPLWMRVLGTKLITAVAPAATIFIPYGKIIGSLFTLIVPLLVGVLIAKYKPNWAVNARKIMRPFIISVLVVVVIFGVAINFWLFKLVSWPIIIAGFLLPWCGFMFGCFTSILLAQKPPDVTAIAIETGVQNTGIAIMLLKLSFPGIDSDVASLLPILVACFTPGPLLLGYGIHSTIKKLRAKNQTTVINISQKNIRNEDSLALPLSDKEMQEETEFNDDEQFSSKYQNNRLQ